MIINFDVSISDLRVTERGLLEERLNSLLRSHRSGSSLVVMDRTTSSWLLLEVNLLSQDRSTLLRIQQQHAQTGDLLKRASHYVRMVGPGHKLIRYAGEPFVRLPLDYPKFSGILDKPALIVEDIENDNHVLNFILKNVPSSLRRAGISYEPVHGGGSRLPSCVKAKATEARVVVAVADADCVSPISWQEKALRFKQACDFNSWPLTFSYIMPCAEVENIFGLNVLSKLDQVASTETYAHLRKIAAQEVSLNHSNAARYEWYFDMKLGLNEAKIQSIVDKNDKEWIEGKLSLAALAKPTRELPGFGNKLCHQILTSNSCMSEFRQTVRSTDWLDVFADFVMDLAWLFASPLEQRT